MSSHYMDSIVVIHLSKLFNFTMLTIHSFNMYVLFIAHLHIIYIA